MFKLIKDNQSGFTLIEVLIAVAIFTIGILSVNVMQISAIKGNSTANSISKSTTWAADKVEFLLGLAYGDSELDDVDGDGTDEDANSDGVDDNGGNFGLDDCECCADGNDPSGNVVVGCTEKSDGCQEKNSYFVYWNVANDHPFPSIKTINVIVNRLDRGVMKSVSVTYMKSSSL